MIIGNYLSFPLSPNIPPLKTATVLNSHETTVPKAIHSSYAKRLVIRYMFHNADPKQKIRTIRPTFPFGKSPIINSQQIANLNAIPSLHPEPSTPTPHLSIERWQKIPS